MTVKLRRARRRRQVHLKFRGEWNRAEKRQIRQPWDFMRRAARQLPAVTFFYASLPVWHLWP